MTPHTPDDFDAMGEAALLLLGACLWWGVLITLVGKLLVRAWRATDPDGFCAGFAVGLILGIPLWELSEWWGLL